MTDDRTSEEPVIRQIVQAPAGTRAVYKCEDGTVYMRPVLAFALYRTRVVLRSSQTREVLRRDWLPYGPHVSGVTNSDPDCETLCDVQSDFKGYLGPGEELTPEWWFNAGYDPPRPQWEVEADERLFAEERERKLNEKP